MHYKETKKKVASGRITHRSLSNSHLFVGEDFSDTTALNNLLQNPQYAPAVLRLDKRSQDLLAWKQQFESSNSQKTPLLIILDGTWRWANAIYTKSTNLHPLPSIRINPALRSEFIVRRQPHKNCLSTIEAALFVIENFSPGTYQNECKQMRSIFRDMNKRYLSFIPEHYRDRYPG